MIHSPSGHVFILSAYDINWLMVQHVYLLVINLYVVYLLPRHDLHTVVPPESVHKAQIHV